MSDPLRSRPHPARRGATAEYLIYFGRNADTHLPLRPPYPAWESHSPTSDFKASLVLRPFTTPPMAYCEHCDRFFVNERSLKQHISHSSRHHFCGTCKREFRTAIGLEQHRVQSSLHHYCQRCAYEYPGESELLEHYEESHAYCYKCKKVCVCC